MTEITDRTPVEYLNEAERAVQEIARLSSVVAEVRHLHSHPRTERHGSGCVSCGIVWPCPTYLATNRGTES